MSCRKFAASLCDSIRNTLTFHLNSHPGAQLTRIILAGGGSELRGVGRALAEMTGVQVVQADPLGGVPVGKQMRASREQVVALTTAIGLTLGVEE